MAINMRSLWNELSTGGAAPPAGKSSTAPSKSADAPGGGLELPPDIQDAPPTDAPVSDDPSAPAKLLTIKIVPGGAKIPAGGQWPFLAVGAYSDGSEKPLPEGVNWIAAPAEVLSINSSGVATAKAPGPAVITAIAKGAIGNTSVQVVPSGKSEPSKPKEAALLSMLFNPPQASIHVGEHVNFLVVGMFDDGSNRNVTGECMWEEGSSSVIEGHGNGSVTGKAVGTATITALHMKFTSVSAQASITVKEGDAPKSPEPKLAYIRIEPQSHSARAFAGMDGKQRFRAIGVFLGYPDQDLTMLAKWRSSDRRVANYVGYGDFMPAFKVGDARITATYGGKEGEGHFFAFDDDWPEPPGDRLKSISIHPQSWFKIRVGEWKQLYATGHYHDGSEKPLDNAVWTSQGPEYLEVQPGGLVCGKRGSGGAPVIVKVRGSQSTPFAEAYAEVCDLVKVEDEDPDHPKGQGLIIVPAACMIAVGQVQRFKVHRAQPDGTAGEEVRTGLSMTFSGDAISSDSVATVIGKAPGVAKITFEADGQQGTSLVTVSDPSGPKVPATPQTPTGPGPGPGPGPTPPPVTPPGPQPASGKSNEVIKGLQKALKKLGYDPGPPDGVMGRQTSEALKQFQKDHGLPADGVAGPATQAAMAQALKATMAGSSGGGFA